MTTDTTTTPETRIDLDDEVPAITITREFAAPPAKVFRAHADAQLFEQWMGPRSTRTRVDLLDCRTGGAYRFASVTDDAEYRFFGSFHEVRPDELIVQTFGFEGMPDGVALERLHLEDLGDGRTRLTATSLCDSFEARDAMVASGMETGIREGYEKLDALLAS